MARDHERSCAAAARGIVEKLLPVLDDLTRAIDAADADEAVPQHHVYSMRMLDRKIYDLMRNEGLEAIPAARGERFDTKVEECVAGDAPRGGAAAPPAGPEGGGTRP